MEEEKIDNSKDQEKEHIISESDLLDVYETQYNDLFPKILKINEEQFLSLLQEQVLITLKIINKLSDLSLMSYFQDFFSERYRTDKKKVTADLEKIMKIPESEIVYLDYSNCYIHCHKNAKCFHKCLNRLILYEGFIYCVHCKKVYNENQIKLYCNECNEIYFSKLRKDIDKNYDYFFPVIFSQPHCEGEFNEDELITCLECGDYLYYDLSKVIDEKYKYKRQFDTIKEIICPNCKLIYDTRKIKFYCPECNEEFMSDAKLYNEFSIYKKKILYLAHTLRKGKAAFPENFNGKKCKCDVNLIKEFYHDYDNGILLEGHKDDKNKIICEECHEVFEKDNINWKCPICGEEFMTEKLVSRNRSRSKNYIRKEIKNEIKKDDLKNDKNEDIKKEDNLNDEKGLIYKKYNNEFKYNPINNNSIGINDNKNYEGNEEKDNNYDKNNENFYKNNNQNNNNMIINNNIYNNKNSINKNQNNINNKNKINIYHINKYNSLYSKNNRNNNNRRNYKMIERKKLNNNDKTEEYKSSRENRKDVNKNISSKIIVDTRNNFSNNNSNNNISINNNHYDYHRRKNFISNRNKNSIHRNRNHHIVNINETSKNYGGGKRNSAIVEQSKKDSKQIENKEENDKEEKKNVEEFKNIQKYFDDFNEEYEQELENKNNFNQQLKYDKDISNKNIRSKINIEKNNHVKNNISNLNKNNVRLNIYNMGNKAKNDSRNKNYYYYDSNNNNIFRYKRQLNASRDNIKEKKEYKQNLSGNKYIKKINSSRQNNIKVNYNNYIKKDNNYNKNNNNNDKNFLYQKNEYSKKESEEQQKKDIKEPEQNDNNVSMEINVSDYKNIRMLGQGSFGKIFLVEDIKTKEQYAMKKLLLDDKIDLKDNQDEFNMIMQMTSSYPELNIIHVYGTETKNFDDYNFAFYVLMEVANCDWERELLNRAKHKAFYTEDEIVYILQNLVDTFAYLQQLGICHRDIKPQNILCFGEKYKISDFGEAKYRKKWRLQQSKVDYTSIQTVRGTELYMSPILYTALKTEPNKGANHNVFKSDVFSLGMCFLFASCLDYKVLYEVRKVNNMSKLAEVVDNNVNKRYSQNFVDTLLNMLQINEKERPDFIELSSMI